MDVVVRHAEPEDYKAVHRIFSGPEVIKGTLQLPFPSAESWRKRLSEPSEDMHQLVTYVGDAVVGEISLWTRNRPRIRHTASFGMAVRDDWQGCGIGAALLEAALELTDNWLDITRIDLQVYTDNEAGIALYEKFGFEIEGTHRCSAFRDGEYVDAYSMARLRI